MEVAAPPTMSRAALHARLDGRARDLRAGHSVHHRAQGEVGDTLGRALPLRAREDAAVTTAEATVEWRDAGVGVAEVLGAAPHGRRRHRRSRCRDSSRCPAPDGRRIDPPCRRRTQSRRCVPVFVDRGVASFPSLQSPPRLAAALGRSHTMVGVAEASPKRSPSASGQDSTSTPSSTIPSQSWSIVSQLSASFGCTPGFASSQSGPQEAPLQHSAETSPSSSASRSPTVGTSQSSSTLLQTSVTPGLRSASASSQSLPPQAMSMKPLASAQPSVQSSIRSSQSSRQGVPATQPTWRHHATAGPSPTRSCMGEPCESLSR